MSPRRWILFIALCGLSGCWATLALYVQTVQIEHWSTIKSIRTGSEPIDNQMLDRAVVDYARALRLMPCNASLYRDMVLLWAQKTDIALNQDDLQNADNVLAQTQAALMSQLACAPRDGKAWLDLAMIIAHREGFTAAALADYKMSATVAPKESWLAQKRLLFAVAFKPLLDTPGLLIAQNDINVLTRAHPNRIHAVMKAAQVETHEDLQAIFMPAQ